MKLRQKAFLLIFITFLCLSLVRYQIAKNTLRQHTWRAEGIMARENVARVQQALDQQLAPLIRSNVDWARWNDTYQFIEDGNQAFYRENLTDTTILTLQSEVVVFGRLNGSLVFATGYDLKKQRKLPLPQALQKYFASGSPILVKAAQRESLKGFLKLPSGILMISSYPVTRGDGTGAIKGFMLLGRWWDAAMQHQLEQVTRLQFSIRPLKENNLPPNQHAIQSSRGADAVTKIVPLSSTTLVGSTVLNDFMGRPVFTLKVETPRPIYQQSQQSLHNLLLSMIVLGCVFSLLMLAITEYLVLHRLERLIGELDAIGDSADRNARVSVSGKDELSHLAEQINITLKALSRARENLEERVTQSTTELKETNTALHAEIVERQMMMGTLRELVQQLENARDEARHASAAKTNFLSHMSHELRTPLNAILGFGQLLESDNLSAEQQDSVEHILKAGHHLLALISEILDITRIEAGTLHLAPEPVKANEVIGEVCAMLQPLAVKRNITFSVGGKLQTPVPQSNIWPTPNKGEELWVWADYQRLKQVLLNLVSNAVKYNKPEGTVYIDFEIQGKSGRIRVRDEGPGLSKEQQERIFAPFDRLGAENTDIEGTGIGLAISKNLAEAMGGTLNFDCKTSQGCLFWVELPLASTPELESETQTTASQRQVETETFITPQNGQDNSKEKYLVYVEDNPSNRRLVEIMIQKRPGFALNIAPDGETGLRLLRAHLPDLLLLDAHLPDMDGEEILSLLRQDAAWNNIPIVIVTADATPEREQRMMQAGANALLTKPIRVTHFWATIENLLGEQQTNPS